MATHDSKPCFYEIDIARLLALDEELSKKLCQSLASISGDVLHETHLKDMSSDPRHCLYVLVDPIEQWTGLGSPTVHCAIQVYLEGAMPNIVSQEDKSAGDAISKTFAYYPQLKSKSLVGARIVHLFEIADASEHGYGSTSLAILTRFYDGQATLHAVQEGPLINPRKKWAKLHYIGVYCDLTVNAVSRWEGYGFIVFFIGKLMKAGAKDPFDATEACVMFKLLREYELEISRTDKRCSVTNLVENLRFTFIRNLSLGLRNLDPLFALRILKSFSRMIQPKDLHAVKKLWKGLDHERVEDFIKFPGILGKFEAITHLIADLAEGYFSGKLPIELSQGEETVLLVNVLQRPNFIQDDNARSNLKNIFEKAVDLYNTLSPEVVDSKGQKI